ncbi:hypothetical protein BUALT_Bualt18G0001300 [Buddleja alternifolia]|uniref:Exopolygalacturonase n=1 Tax=Buddleja alternifolia TaxID=168488 RepID=A0AAV6W318_9LAMI|nr:hypothetical protein BUALT_Bualt18G0001300 [Buddleja alternifolia]
MDTKIVAIILFIVFLSILNFNVHGQTNNFIVNDFGAVADGKTDNSKAFVNAWKRACETDGGIVSVPLGTYFVREADFEGPCIGQTLFHIDGTLLASNDPMLDEDYWITFYKVDRLTVSGNGTFDGNGANSWANCGGIAKCNLPPTTLKINYVNNSYIQGLHFVNSKMFHLHIHESDNVNVNYVHILAPEDSPNTDGIHIGNSNDIKIFNAHIATGDDCISMGDGSTNINISSVWCGPGHGISIGSLGKYKVEEDVSGITVRNCTFNNTDNGLRIKTWAPSASSPVVSDVAFVDIDLINVRNPIIIDQYYCPSGSCGNEGESSVEIKRVKFVDVKGSSATETAVDVQCSKSKPCQDIEFIDLDIGYNGQPTNASCSNADDLFRGSDQVPSRCS